MEIFSCGRLWRFLSNVFDVEYEPYDEESEFDIVRVMKYKERVWDEIVEEIELEKTKMGEIASLEVLNVVLHFELQHVCSMNTSPEYGFFGYVDTFRSICLWVDRHREMKIIPTI
ncbi:hypothetical protein IFM89_010045 [Coptis chinensis]|uniref:Uncharacterized protein n=1 Tax=Coptis chinensis TaxID=261450 RepID=A0A835HLJ0_9MAGN|nr:hypothetical protein IFM89_010045 [Coptis chinensis]